MSKFEKEIASETKVQEQSRSEIYPINITIVNKIGDGFEYIGTELVDSRSAVKIAVNIDRVDYCKEDVLISLKEACLQLLEYYC